MGHDDVGGGLGDAGVEDPHGGDGERAADHLGGDEARRGGRFDAGEVLEMVRPMVTAGFAKLVEEVKK